ncbi:MAG: hypothetical protein ACTSP4_00510 [Candidatus Hodarchaeales archaeon]
MTASKQPTFDITPEVEQTNSGYNLSAYSELSRTINDFSQTTGVIAGKYLTRKAAISGSLAGAKKDYKPRENVITGEQAAFQQAAIQSHRSVINTTITDKVNDIYNKWTTPKSTQNPNGGLDENSLSNYNDEISAWGKSYIANQYPMFKQIATEKLATLGSSGSAKIMKSVGSIIKNEQKENILSSNKQTHDQIKNLAFDGKINQAKLLLSKTEKTMQSGVDHAVFTGTEYHSAIDPMADDLKKYSVLSEAKRLIPLGQIEKFRSDINSRKDLSSLEKQQYIKSGDEMNSSFITDASAKNAETEDKMRANISDQLTNGANADPDIQSHLSVTDPEKSVGYKKLSEMSQNVYSSRQNLKYMNIDEAKKQLTETKLNPKSPDFPQQQQELLATQGYYANYLKRLENNSYEETKDAPSVKDAVRNTQESKGFNDLPDGMKEAEVKVSTANAQVALYKAMGLPKDEWKVMSGFDQRQIQSILVTGTPADQQNALENMALSYGPQATLALKQMSKTVPQSIMDLVGLNNPQMANSVVNLPIAWEGIMTPQKDLNDAVKHYGNKISDYYDEANSVLSDYLKTFGNGSKDVQLKKDGYISNVVKSAMMYTKIHGKGADYAVDKMAKALYLDRYNHVGDIRIPKPYSPDMVNLANRAYAWAVNSGDIKFDPMNKVGGDPRLRPEDQLKEDEIHFKSGHFKNVGDDTQGIVWVSDNNVRAVRQDSKKPLQWKFSDLEIPGSETNNIISKYLYESGRRPSFSDIHEFEKSEAQIKEEIKARNKNVAKS